MRERRVFREYGLRDRVGIPFVGSVKAIEDSVLVSLAPMIGHFASRVDYMVTVGD